MFSLSTEDLVHLVQRVFRPRESDRALGILVDLPDEHVADTPAWSARRAIAADWRDRLDSSRSASGLEAVELILYRNVRRNNADLPSEALLHVGGRLPDHADRIRQDSGPMAAFLETHPILIALTQFSATAPLKVTAPQYGFRAATLPGFRPEMIPALKLDYAEISERCDELKALLDEALAARLLFEAAGECHELTLDLRYRSATASGGQLTEPGTAGNLPAGETYIVPYEGERAGDPSRSSGTLPLELDGELMFYRIENNRVADVLGQGTRAARERSEVEREPAYANVAELGLGVLAGYGVKPIGELLLDEKLGLHVAFGRSDHFGGQVGVSDFSAPERVVHIDRVYLPEVQPQVRAKSVDLELPSGTRPLMRDGAYV
jgi:hypothetical protein